MNLWNYLCSEVTRGYMLENDEVCFNYFEFCYIIQKNCLKQNSSFAQFYKTRHNQCEIIDIYQKISLLLLGEIYLSSPEDVHIHENSKRAGEIYELWILSLSRLISIRVHVSTNQVPDSIDKASFQIATLCVQVSGSDSFQIFTMVSFRKIF